MIPAWSWVIELNGMIMKLRIMSDIHLEFSDFKIPDLPDDRETILILAGDIGLVHKRNLADLYIPFLSRANIQFRKVILIVGNHEHYGGSLVKTVPVLRDQIASANLENVHLLQNETVTIDDVAFIGATLWTDCDRNNPNASYLFRGMSDSRVIRTGPADVNSYLNAFSAPASATEHAISKKYIGKAILEAKAAGLKTVVVAHHGVTMRSIHSMYAGSEMNMFYASEMTEFWYDHNPTLIVHGHTHKQFDYLVDETLEHCQSRVIVNPRGYEGHEDTSGFNETLIVEV